MTTMGDKLRAEAQKLRSQADALEIAAQVMDGQQLQAKRVGAEQAFAKAATLRTAHRNGSNGGAPAAHPARTAHRVLSREQRVTLIHQLLASGPHFVRDIHAHLEAHGLQVTRSRVGQILKEMPELRATGHGSQSRWALRKPRATGAAAGAAE